MIRCLAPAALMAAARFDPSFTQDLELGPGGA